VEILEKELLDALKNSAVKQLTVQRQENGTYRVTVNLTWKPGDFILTTTRKHPREWSSLDRFIAYLKDANPVSPRIILLA
jgi:hypothetical protein